MPILAVDTELGRVSGLLTPNDQPYAGRQYYFVRKAPVHMIAAVLDSRAKNGAAVRAQEAVTTFLADFARSAGS